MDDEMRRSRATAAAVRLALRGGLTAVTLAAVARACDEQPGELRRLFPTRAELLVAVHLASFAGYTEILQAAIVAPADTPRARLAAFTDFGLDTNMSMDDRLVFAGLSAALADHRIARARDAWFRTCEQALVTMIAAIHPALPADECKLRAAGLLSLVTGVLLRFGESQTDLATRSYRRAQLRAAAWRLVDAPMPPAAPA